MGELVVGFSGSCRKDSFSRSLESSNRSPLAPALRLTTFGAYPCGCSQPIGTRASTPARASPSATRAAACAPFGARPRATWRLRRRCISLGGYERPRGRVEQRNVQFLILACEKKLKIPFYNFQLQLLRSTTKKTQISNPQYRCGECPREF